jgi:hypothetical protein
VTPEVKTFQERGLATVVLPDYFEALNGDFRYQLTVIGQFAHHGLFDLVGRSLMTNIWRASPPRQPTFPRFGISLN